MKTKGLILAGMLALIAFAPQSAAAKCGWVKASPPLWVCDDPNPPKKQKKQVDTPLKVTPGTPLGPPPFIVTTNKCGVFRCRVKPMPPPKCERIRCRVHR